MNDYDGSRREGSGAKGCLAWGCGIAFVLGLLGLGGLGGLGYFGYRGATEVTAVAEEFLGSLIAAEYQQAYQLLTPDQRAAVSLEQFSALHNDAFAALGACSYQMRGLNVNRTPAGTVTRLDYSLQCDSGPGRITLLLTKAEETWLVKAIEHASERVPIQYRCANCATEFTPPSNFCSQCGEPLPPSPATNSVGDQNE